MRKARKQAPRAIDVEAKGIRFTVKTRIDHNDGGMAVTFTVYRRAQGKLVELPEHGKVCNSPLAPGSEEAVKVIARQFARYRVKLTQLAQIISRTRPAVV